MWPVRTWTSLFERALYQLEKLHDFAADSDGDGLTDGEEVLLGLNPVVPDEDGDGAPDGRALATELAHRIGDLPAEPQPSAPYVEHHPLRGFDPCLSCGTNVDMGFLRLVNPAIGHSVGVAYYGLHFMQHGSFSTDRAEQVPRVDVVAVTKALGIEVVGSNPAPSAFSFWNAPNPFSTGSSTTIVLALPSPGDRVTIDVFDVQGRRLCGLYEGIVRERVLRTAWDGCDGAGRAVAAGVYLCKARIGSLTVTQKLTVMQ